MARARGEDQKENSPGAGADNGAGNCGESSQEGALMNQGPGGRKRKEGKKKGDRHARRSQDAMTALAAPDLQRPVH